VRKVEVKNGAIKRKRGERDLKLAAIGSCKNLRVLFHL